MGRGRVAQSERKITRILCNLSVAPGSKGKFYWTTIRPTLYMGMSVGIQEGSYQEDVMVNVHMLRWMCRKTLRDSIRN